MSEACGLHGSRRFKGYWQLQGAPGPGSQAWAWIVSSASTFEMLRLILEIDLLVIFHSLWLFELSVLKLGERL